jgi:hypothetical protein
MIEMINVIRIHNNTVSKQYNHVTCLEYHPAF